MVAATIIAGSVSCSKIDDLDRRLDNVEDAVANPLTLVSLNIIPDYSDGGVSGVRDAAAGEGSPYSFNLSVAVAPNESCTKRE